MLRRLNEVFLQRDINIAAQYLETAGDLGYVVLDADLGGGESGALLAQIRALEGTVGARLVFEH
jgi:D-3-phosphoglycerate dehydrogenase